MRDAKIRAFGWILIWIGLGLLLPVFAWLLWFREIAILHYGGEYTAQLLADDRYQHWLNAVTPVLVLISGCFILSGRLLDWLFKPTKISKRHK